MGAATTAKAVWSRYVKISGVVILAIGVLLIFTAASNSVYWYRSVLGVISVGVGLWGCKSGYSQRHKDAKIYYYLVWFLNGSVVVVNVTVLIGSREIADQICSQEDIKTTFKDNPNLCEDTRSHLITVAISAIMLSICLLTPLAYAARRYQRAIEYDIVTEALNSNSDPS